MSMFDDENEVLENEEDEYNGFQVYDDNEIYRRKILAAAMQETDAETIASPIPENEQKVIVDNADFLNLYLNQKLTIVFSDVSTSVECDGKKVATLKNAFTQKLQEKRKGSYAKVTLYSVDPPMIKLEFSKTETQEYNIKIF